MESELEGTSKNILSSPSSLESVLMKRLSVHQHYFAITQNLLSIQKDNANSQVRTHL